MAARRVSLGYLVSSVLLAVGAAAATFQLKYEVRDLEGDLAGASGRGSSRSNGRCRATRADLAYLTRPDRLVLQAQQLNLVPARGGRIVSASQLPDWEQLQWAKAPMLAFLPSGGEIELRAKPLPPLADRRWVPTMGARPQGARRSCAPWIHPWPRAVAACGWCPRPVRRWPSSASPCA